MECDFGCCRGPQSLKSTRLSFLVQVVRPPKLPDPVSEICHQLQQVGIRWESGSRTGLGRLQIKNQKQRCPPLSKRQALRREIRAIRSSLKKRRRRQSLNATNTPSPATIRISAPGAKRRPGREDPIDRPMEQPRRDTWLDHPFNISIAMKFMDRSPVPGSRSSLTPS